MRTSYSYFSGGCGADIGLEAAGYAFAGGVESDTVIASVAAQNGHRLTVADVRSVDPAALLTTAPDWFHASPVCKSFSQAKTNGEELQSDIEMAQATARFIRYWLPATVSIENVWQYRESASFKCITDCLTECGYSFDFWHLNSADYGVAQTRKRLILVARRGLWYIQRPSATHQETADMFSPAWNGWYAAIEDLIPTLPASAFAPWQMERLPAELRGSFNATKQARAFIVDQLNASYTTIRSSDDPVFTLTNYSTKHPAPRAFLVHSTDMRSMPIRDEGELAFTVLAHSFDTSHAPGGNPRARLTSGRVVSMTPRALARFQSFPDSYWLPEKSGLACTVIGNAVPPLLMQRVAESVAI